MILATYNRKGGVGKTTASVNLAAALAELDLRVLLVDLDPQGSTSLSLGVPRADFSPSIADVILRSRSVADVLRSSQVPGLDLITSSADLNLIESSLSAERRPHEVVSRALESVKEMYHVIIIDCAASLGLMARAALVASDSFLVPTEPSHLSYEGLRNTIETARRCCHQNGSRSNLLGILVNRCRANAAPHRRAIEALRKRVRQRSSRYADSLRYRCRRGSSHGKPVTTLCPASEAADAYRRLALELCERVGIDAPKRDQLTSQDEMTGSGWVSPASRLAPTDIPARAFRQPNAPPQAFCALWRGSSCASTIDLGKRLFPQLFPQAEAPILQSRSLHTEYFYFFFLFSTYNRRNSLWKKTRSSGLRKQSLIHQLRVATLPVGMGHLLVPNQRRLVVCPLFSNNV